MYRVLGPTMSGEIVHRHFHMLPLLELGQSLNKKRKIDRVCIYTVRHKTTTKHLLIIIRTWMIKVVIIFGSSLVLFGCKDLIE